MEFKIGQGYDVHQLVENRELIIGGVRIPFEKGLLGHSDADVLVHALIDALLGALGKGDIGSIFPDNDIIYKDADSIELLKIIYRDYIKDNWKINNIDSTIIAQKPKLNSYIQEIRTRLSNVLEVNANLINIKAKTNEKLGYLGESKGIEAQVVVLLFK